MSTTSNVPSRSSPPNLHAVKRLNLRVQVFAAQARFAHVVRQILRQPLRQRRHQRALPLRRTLLRFGDEVLHLPGRRAHFNLRIDKPRRTDHLLDDFAVGDGELILPGRGGDEEAPGSTSPLNSSNRIGRLSSRGREPETVIHQHLLAMAVAGVHGVDLRNRHVRFINDEQVIFGEVINQGVGLGPRRRAGEVAGIVFDAGAPMLVSCSISTSYFVRASSRCASSSFPCKRSSFTR